MAHGPLILKLLLGLNNLNNFSLTCLLKKFTTKKLSPSTDIDTNSTVQASHEAYDIFYSVDRSP